MPLPIELLSKVTRIQFDNVVACPACGGWMMSAQVPAHRLACGRLHELERKGHHPGVMPKVEAPEVETLDLLELLDGEREACASWLEEKASEYGWEAADAIRDAAIRIRNGEHRGVSPPKGAA